MSLKPEFEAIRNALSKLESQICRDPSLPPAYRDILFRGWTAINRIEKHYKPWWAVWR